MNPNRPTLFHLAMVALTSLLFAACNKKDDGAQTAGDTHAGGESPAAAAAPTNRVDIPASVRKNLGLTFAKVEARNVARTVRVPGRFELLPTARREYRSALGGRVELLVDQYQTVAVGTPLFRLNSTRWHELQNQLNAAESSLEQATARLESMEPMRAAHRRHEESLAAKIQLWTSRLAQLDVLKREGGGSGRELAEVEGTLNATQAELAETMEKDAELASRVRELSAEVKSARATIDLLLDTASSVSGVSVADLQSEMKIDGKSKPRWRTMSELEIRAAAPGVVEKFNVTNGGMVDVGGLTLSTVQPERIRFNAQALQADLGSLKAGLPARIVPSAGQSISIQDQMTGDLVLGLGADPDARTIELLVTPGALRPWAREGVSAYLEVTLDGGQEELAIPLSCVTRDGTRPIIFRRDPADPDKVIRMEADLGISDGRWVVVASGVRQGDEIVLDGVYQLMLATAGNVSKGGHFHSDGTFHEEGH